LFEIGGIKYQVLQTVCSYGAYKREFMPRGTKVSPPPTQAYEHVFSRVGFYVLLNYFLFNLLRKIGKWLVKFAGSC